MELQLLMAFMLEPNEELAPGKEEIARTGT